MKEIKYIPTKKIIDYSKTDRAHYEKTCLFCNLTFFPARIDAKYCSASCRTKANAKRHNLDIRGSRVENKQTTYHTDPNYVYYLKLKAKTEEQLQNIMASIQRNLKDYRLRREYEEKQLELEQIEIKLDKIIDEYNEKKNQ